MLNMYRACKWPERGKLGRISGAGENIQSRFTIDPFRGTFKGIIGISQSIKGHRQLATTFGQRDMACNSVLKGLVLLPV